MKTFFVLICATGLFLAKTEAQTSKTDTTTTTTTTTESTGTITEFTPGTTIVLNTGSGEPVHYKFDKNVTYFNAKGKAIDSAKIKKDRKVRVHYVKEGNGMVVDKVTVVRE